MVFDSHLPALHFFQVLQSGINDAFNPLEFRAPCGLQIIEAVMHHRHENTEDGTGYQGVQDHGRKDHKI
jgi:hypothetical protein